MKITTENTEGAKGSLGKYLRKELSWR